MNITLQGTEIEFEYTEPSVNVDGTPLTDLGKTELYYSIEGIATKAMEKPASSPNGGGIITDKIVVPIGENKEANVEFYAIAYDLTGNPSPQSIPVWIRIDHLPPSAPL